MTSLEKEIKELESWVDTNIRRTAWISKKEVLGLVGERATKIREIFDEREYHIYTHEDFVNFKKEVLAVLVEAKK